MTPVAHRTWDVPNPYDLPLPTSTESLLVPEPPPWPEPSQATRYFVIEDSADMMGLPVRRNVLLGFQVEFVGPGEEPAVANRTTRTALDPYHPRFLMPTAGLRVRF